MDSIVLDAIVEEVREETPKISGTNPVTPFIPEEELSKRQLRNMKRTCVAAGWVALGAVVLTMLTAICLPMFISSPTRWVIWLCMALEASSFGFYQLFAWIAQDVIGTVKEK